VAETLILGIGNPLRGDDGLGSAVIEWLHEHKLPAQVLAAEGGTAGLDLVTLLTGYRRAIIVDAAEVGRAPGDWLRYTLDAVQLKERESKLSLHAAGLAEALALGAALGTLPAEVIIYGVQPAQLDWAIGLSDKVQLAVPRVGRAILKEIEEHHGQNLDH
jgi:hydrogenase maturation protease